MNIDFDENTIGRIVKSFSSLNIKGVHTPLPIDSICQSLHELNFGSIVQRKYLPQHDSFSHDSTSHAVELNLFTVEQWHLMDPTSGCNKRYELNSQVK